MKKWMIGLLALCLLLVSNSAMATNDHNDDDNKGNKDKCYAAVIELRNSVSKAKTEDEKNKLWIKILELKKKCEKSEDKPKNLNDSQRVQADKDALSIGYASGDSASRVTQNIQLPSKGTNGSSISWISGAPTTIANDGKLLNRPQNGTTAIVVMFAVIQYGKEKDFKTFSITINPQLADADRVAADKAALAIDFGGNDTASSVTRAVDWLPTVGANGTQITWTSSAPNVVSHDGKTVNRPTRGAGDASVVLTAVIKSGNVSDIKVFVLTVKQSFTDEERVAADKAELAVIYQNGDHAGRVTSNLTLPVKGAYGSDIMWVSEKPNVIANNGTVVRPAWNSGDASVVLTAIITYNGRADYKSFTLVVKAN